MLRQARETLAEAPHDLEYRHRASIGLLLESPVLPQNLHPDHILNLEEKLATPILTEIVSSIGIAVSLDMRLDKALPFKLKINSYRIVQEALTHVSQHRQSKAVRIRLHSLDKTLSLMIPSQGFGLDELSKDPGLETIRKRVESSHGRFRLLTKRGSESCLAILWSLQSQ